MAQQSDLEDGTAGAVDGNTLASGNIDDLGDEEIHDQLPSVEEYKANMANVGSSPRSVDEIGIAPNSQDDEDPEVNVHDQLPSVEEVKAATNPQSKDSGCQSCVRVFMIILVLLVILFAVLIPTVFLNDGNLFRPPRYEKVVTYLVGRGISTEDSLRTRGSAQYNAAKWIADNDGYYYPIPTSDSTHTRFIERYALAVLYFSTGGPNWRFQMNFLTPVDHCSRNDKFMTTSGIILQLGVTTCHEEAGTSTEAGYLVQKIGLPSNNLAGQIPDEIQWLHKVENFAAPFNENLGGKIPWSMSKLDDLRELQFQYCSLTGSIPSWMGDLQEMRNLGLGNNLLTGSIPVSLSKLTKMERLGFDDNLLQGDVAIFKPLTNLLTLYLEDNSFTGELTDTMVADWKDLRELDISTNSIDSSIPGSLFSLKDLKIVDLHGNRFHSNIPEITAVNSTLRFLAIHDNDVSGSIPESISKLEKLAHLDVSINSLVSPLPLTLGDMMELRYLFLGNNAYGEQAFPSSVLKLTRLRELSMKNSNIIGTLPTTISALNSLQVLDLDSNKLQGTIPSELGLVRGLDHLLLNRNQLSGQIPSSFSLLNDLDVVVMDANMLNGTADVICKSAAVKPDFFSLDCEGPDPPIRCSCCTLCCTGASNTTCNNFDWHVNLDPIWEFSFSRQVYQFSQETLPP